MAWRWGAAAVGSVLAVGVIAAAWLRLGLESAAAVATVIAALPVITSLLAWAYRSSRTGLASTPAQVDAAVELLARAVRSQWRAEAAVRRILDPEPLAVRWRASRLPVADSPGVAGTLAGRTDQVDRLADAFLRLPHRRLVLIGEPGSGKTTLAVLLTLVLCDHRRAGDPVPVLLSAPSWDPVREHLHAWVARRLGEDYPALRDIAAYGPTAPADMVANRSVLPVIDGLDELPDARRSAALLALNRALVARDPIVLTCRTAEFQAAIADADVLSAAAVVEPLPVLVSDVVALLHATVARGSAAARWRPVLAEMRSNPQGPLASALSSPLMLSLVRTVYPTADSDPAELLAPGHFPDRASLEEHLLDALVPAAIGGEQASGLQDRGWEPQRARRWLTFLAQHLDRRGTRDLAWWQLHQALPDLARGLALGAAGALIVAIVDAVATGSGLALIDGATFGVLFGLFAGRPPGGPMRTAPSLRRSRLALVGALAGGLVSGLAVTVLVTAGQFVIWLLVRATMGLALGNRYGESTTLLGIQSGLVIGLASGLSIWARTPTGAGDGTSPQAVLRGDRVVPAAGGLLVAAATVLVYGLVITFLSGIFGTRLGVRWQGTIAIGLQVGLVFALVGGAGAAAAAPRPGAGFRSAPRAAVRGLASGLAFGLANGALYEVSIVLLGGRARSFLAEAPHALGFTAEVALLLGLVGALASAGSTTGMRALAIGLRWGLAGGMALGYGSGIVTGLVLGFADPLAPELKHGLGPALFYATDLGMEYGVKVALALGLAGGLAGGILWAIASAGEPGGRAARMSTLVRALGRGLGNGVGFGIVGAAAGAVAGAIAVSLGATDGLTLGADHGLRPVVAVGIVNGLTGGLVLGLLRGLLGGAGRAWPAYLTACAWLALRGRLPWRLMAFLDDMHQLGLLRQVGPVYQFRHARLQDHLARWHRRPSAPTVAASDTRFLPGG